jgi:diacylglycerol kinase (ATP)
VSRHRATRIITDSERMIHADVDDESVGRLPMSVTMLPFHLKATAPIRLIL